MLFLGRFLFQVDVPKYTLSGRFVSYKSMQFHCLETFEWKYYVNWVILVWCIYVYMSISLSRFIDVYVNIITRYFNFIIITITIYIHVSKHVIFERTSILVI